MGDLAGAEAAYRRADAGGFAPGSFGLAELLHSRGDQTGADAAYRQAARALASSGSSWVPGAPLSLTAADLWCGRLASWLRSDSDNDIRTLAARGLGSCDNPGAVTVLVTALIPRSDDRYAAVAEEAQQALVRIGVIGDPTGSGRTRSERVVAGSVAKPSWPPKHLSNDAKLEQDDPGQTYRRNVHWPHAGTNRSVIMLLPPRRLRARRRRNRVLNRRGPCL